MNLTDWKKIHATGTMAVSISRIKASPAKSMAAAFRSVGLSLSVLKVYG